MQNRNWVLLGVAVAVGLFAVLLANAWFSGVEQQQQGGIGGDQKLTSIVVAAQPLEFGARLTAQNVRLQNWPEGSVPEGAYRSLGDALKFDRVAIRPIVPGEPVLASKVSGTDGRATLAALLPNGMRALSIPINPVSGVSGFVLPGSMVDVLLTRKINNDASGRGGQRSDVILENVQVLAIDQLASDKQSEPKLAKTATLALSLFDAQRLVVAQQSGSLSLVLRKPTDGDLAAAGPAMRSVTSYDLGGSQFARPASAAAPASTRGGGSGSVQVPALPTMGSGSSLPPAWSGPTMTIIRGTQPTAYPVGQTKGR